MDRPGRFIRKKYTAPDGSMALHVPATSTPEQIQRVYDLIGEIHKLEREALDRGIFEKPENWTGDGQTRLNEWVATMTRGEAEHPGELMTGEIEDFLKVLDGWKKLVRKKLGGEDG